MNILVTGGGSGLGKAITLKLASNPNDCIYFTYFKSKSASDALEKKYSNVKGIYVDFDDDESLENLLNKIEEIKLDVLINNALPINNTSHFHKISTTDFLSSFQSNILPVIKISQKAILVFRKAKFGKIITILSSAIINKPPIGWSEYVAEKNYLLSISKSIATENANFNITSNCVSPSFMQTNLNSKIDERVVEDMIAKHPLKNILTTEETAETVAFLVSASQQLNGTNIIINSGSNIT